MDQPVHPVEIRIMHDQHEGKCRPEIDPSMLRNILVEGSVYAETLVFQQNERGKRENNDRDA